MIQNWRKQLSPNPSPEFGDAWRVLHSEECWIDEFAGRWLVQTSTDDRPDELAAAVDEGLVKSVYWRPRSKSADTAPAHLAGEIVKEPFFARENGALAEIDFSAGYSSGIFLDQRENRARVARWSREMESPRVLNTFAYTGAFSVVAALAGATTTTLDLSGPYLEWAKRNFSANEMNPADHYFAKGDTFEWLATFARQGRTFQGIILDPPTFSRSRGKKRKAPFRVEKDYAELVAAAARIIDRETGGWILCCANTHKLAAVEFDIMVQRGLDEAGVEGRLKAYDMPREFGRDRYLKTLKVDI